MITNTAFISSMQANHNGKCWAARRFSVNFPIYRCTLFSLWFLFKCPIGFASSFDSSLIPRSLFPEVHESWFLECLQFGLLFVEILFLKNWKLRRAFPILKLSCSNSQTYRSSFRTNFERTSTDFNRLPGPPRNTHRSQHLCSSTGHLCNWC